MSPADFRRLAAEADEMAADFRALAERCLVAERAERVMQCAVNREADAEFYRSRAEILEHSKVMQ